MENLFSQPSSHSSVFNRDKSESKTQIRPKVPGIGRSTGKETLELKKNGESEGPGVWETDDNLGEDGSSSDWRLLDHFELWQLVSKNMNTFPPKNVLLSDWWVGRIIPEFSRV